jgi:hypothetical protein
MLLELLATALLIRTDIAALQGAKLSPNATNAIAAMTAQTPRVLDRCTYGTYPATAPGVGLTVAMSYLFEAGEIGAGSQIHFKIGGTFVNDGGSAYAAGAQARITSGNTIVFMGSRPQAATTAPASMRSARGRPTARSPPRSSASRASTCRTSRPRRGRVPPYSHRAPRSRSRTSASS